MSEDIIIILVAGLGFVAGYIVSAILNASALSECRLKVEELKSRLKSQPFSFF